MAESPIKITRSDDGLFVRYEFDAHYISDEEAQSIRGYIDQLETENAKLRELVRDMWRDGMCECDERGACAECEYHFPDRMRELGIEVDA